MSTAYHLDDIRFLYDNQPVLSLPELSIPADKITALIGPNGCGKSTLLHLLAFLHKQQQGHIEFFSQLVNAQTISDFRKRIALLPQNPYMLRGTVNDNLYLTLRFHHRQHHRDKQIQSVLKKLNIVHLQHKQAKSLSGGEQQKVALARAIITNPDVLLMDEPFSYLDHSSNHLLEEFIKGYVSDAKKTLIFSTHNRLQGMAIADEVISLVQGKSVKTALINVYQGSIRDNIFDTGKIKILLTETTQNFKHISIDPSDIVLSRTPLHSSMRNQYQGKVTAISDEMGAIRVSINAGELFQVLITYQSLKELNIAIGEQLWVNFKSNAILAF